LVPVWNEEVKVGKVIDDLRQNITADILVVDDGSCDKTSEIAQNKRCVVIRHPVNLGIGAAIRTGIKYAMANDYEIIVIVSGSGKTPAVSIPNLLNPILKEGYDFIQGSRYLAGAPRLPMPLHRSFGTRLYSLIFSLFLSRKITDGTSGFRAIRVAMLKDRRFLLDQPWLNRYELEPYLYYKSVRLGYKVKEVPVIISYPKRNYTKMRAFIDWWKISRPLFFLKLGLKR